MPRRLFVTWGSEESPIVYVLEEGWKEVKTRLCQVWRKSAKFRNGGRHVQTSRHSVSLPVWATAPISFSLLAPHAELVPHGCGALLEAAE